MPLDFRDPLDPLVKREREEPVVSPVPQVPADPLESVYVPMSNLFRYSLSDKILFGKFHIQFQLNVYIMFSNCNHCVSCIGCPWCSWFPWC